MKLREIETPISTLSGIGPVKAKLFANLGIYTIADLLAYYPKDWEDRTQRIPLSQFREHKVHTIALVTGHSWFGYGRMKTLKISIADTSGRGELVAFNRPFLEKSLTVGAIIAVTGHICKILIPSNFLFVITKYSPPPLRQKKLQTQGIFKIGKQNQFQAPKLSPFTP